MASYNYTFTSGDTVTPTKLNSARTVSEIVNADIKSDAAIAGTKIAPNFGSQNIVTTGTLSANSAAFSGSITLPAAGGVSMASVTNSGLNFNGGTTFNTNGASITLRGSTATFNGHGLELYAGGSERMRIDASGNVGIGATPDVPLHVYRASSNTYARLQNASQVDTYWSFVNAGSASEFLVGLAGNGASGYVWDRANRGILFGTNNAERMRIDSSGNVLIGTTAALDLTTGSTTGFTYVNSSPELRLSNASGGCLGLRRTGTDGVLVAILKGTSSVGSISATTTATSFNTSSDYRLKQNVEPMVGGLAKLNSLAPKTFEFKAEPNVKVDGFIAHEVQAVVPQAVTGEKDGEQMQGMDNGKLVPVLVAAVQELAAKVEALEAA